MNPENGLRTDRFVLGGRTLPLLNPVRTYTCGITPYDVTHLGHAATFVWADVLAAVVASAGATAVTARNVTDVDDVLTVAAASRNQPYDEFALVQEFLFDRDMAALRIAAPTHVPRARHHVVDVQRLALALLAGGRAYEREGRVYFRGDEVPARAGLDPSTARVLATENADDPDDPLRDDPFDVPVWRPSRDGEPGWPSPWGRGRPGWHAECAAMAIAVHGAVVDVVIGGADLAFPHHAYQAAMVEAATGAGPFSRGSLHVGSVHRDGRRMAKSTGNLTLVSDLLADHSPAALRLLLLDRRYDADWKFDASLLTSAENRLTRLYAAAGRPTTSEAAVDEAGRALLTDLNVPAALDVAESEGGEAARRLLGTLKLT
ncbi:cysteine--tRNA ligase [Cryptosporangium sp. NPDC051539]|uniref:cysteine--tRNA ligase n=1 Tax=Cryptosporangium sp. NPDC051539 TaxID=3363962 RepID=UPI00378942A8